MPSYMPMIPAMPTPASGCTGRRPGSPRWTASSSRPSAIWAARSALLETTEDRLHLGRAHLLNAEILLASGDNEQAGEQLTLSDSLLDGNEDAQERAWFLVEKARWEARTGDGEQAVAHAREALQLVDEDPHWKGGRSGRLPRDLPPRGRPTRRWRS